MLQPVLKQMILLSSFFFFWLCVPNFWGFVQLDGDVQCVYHSRDDDSLIANLSRLDAIVWSGPPAELHPVGKLNLDLTPVRNIPL